jgi:hypothetical protein
MNWAALNRAGAEPVGDTACQSTSPQKASELVESRHGGRLNLLSNQHDSE